MALREKVSESILKYASIPEGKGDVSRRFYYKNYEDNLYCPLGPQALDAYDKGNGAETKPTEKISKGKLVVSPAKMASIVSSSAMTFNLLGNDPIRVISDNLIPRGVYDVQYEKQMYTVKRGSYPAHLDAFLSNIPGKTAVFCEMKFLEWLGAPGGLKDAYMNENIYFEPDNYAVNFPRNAYEAFSDVIMELTDRLIPDKENPKHNTHRSICTRYDAWQMMKHLLAIYNYTSFVTKSSVEALGKFPSMAGDYNRIILLNVVNEFPPECIEDANAREEYIEALRQEHREAELFADIIKHSKIPHLFDNNCGAGIEVKYVSAKQFADVIEMSIDKQEYLKRYFT